MIFTKKPFDDFVLDDLEGATDALGGTLTVLRYFRCAESTGPDLFDSVGVENGLIVGSPSLAQPGYVFGESNGGNAISLNGTSQYLNLGAMGGLLSSLKTTGIFLSGLFRSTALGNGAQVKSYFHGHESGANRGIAIGMTEVAAGYAIRVRIADNAGNAAVWEFGRLYCEHFAEDRFHQLTVSIKLPSSGATTSANVTVNFDGTPYHCTSHTSATLGAITDWSAGRLFVCANGSGGSVSYATTQGVTAVQRLVIGAGQPTLRQIVDLFRQCSRVFMGVADPCVAAYMDTKADTGATVEGSPVSAVVNYGDPAFSIAQATANNQPTWTADFGGGVDFGAGLDTVVQTLSKWLYISRSTATRELSRGDRSCLVVWGAPVNTFRGQAANIAELYDAAGSPPTTLMLAFGQGDITASSNENGQLGLTPQNGTRTSAKANGNASAKPPSAIPTFSVVGGLTGRNSSGNSQIGPGSVYCDGEFQPVNVDTNGGTYYTPASGTGNIATIGAIGTASRFGGICKAYVDANRTITDIEAVDFHSHAAARWPENVVDPAAEDVLMFVGDSVTHGQLGTVYKTSGWPRYLGVNGRKVLCYNPSVRNYYITDATLNMTTRMAQDQWYAMMSGKRVTVAIYIGTNDAGSDSAATMYADWQTLASNIRSKCVAAGAVSVKILGVGLRPGLKDDFVALLVATPGQADAVVQLPAFELAAADSLHPTEAGAIAIAQAIKPSLRTLNPNLFKTDKIGYGAAGLGYDARMSRFVG